MSNVSPFACYAAETFAETFAVNQVHDEVVQGSIGAVVDDPHDVGMIELGADAGFTLKPFLAGLTAQMRIEKLDRDPASEALLDPFEHQPHAPRAIKRVTRQPWKVWPMRPSIP